MKKNDIENRSLPPIEVIDLFCGIGGLSFGMKSKGFDILAGYDLDATCRYAYETNNEAKFIYKDIKTVSADEIDALYSKDAIRVLAGCAPCQPFSSYAFKNKKKDPNKYDLLYEFGRLVKDTLPDIVTMENVSQILAFKDKPVLSDFVNLLKENDYQKFKDKVVIETDNQDLNLSEIPPFTDKIKIVEYEISLAKILPDNYENSDHLSSLINQFIGLGLNKERIGNLFGISEEPEPSDIFQMFSDQVEVLENAEQLAFLLGFTHPNQLLGAFSNILAWAVVPTILVGIAFGVLHGERRHQAATVLGSASSVGMLVVLLLYYLLTHSSEERVSALPWSYFFGILLAGLAAVAILMPRLRRRTQEERPEFTKFLRYARYFLLFAHTIPFLPTL